MPIRYIISTKELTFAFSEEKNNKLKTERNVSFEEVITEIESDRVVDVVEHHNQRKYFGQSILIVEIDSYAFEVPFVMAENYFFLKTIYPSRKQTNKYLLKGKTYEQK